MPDFSLELPNGQRVATGRPRASMLDDPRTQRFRLATFVDRGNLPPLQEHIAPPAGFTPGLWANDRVGDCTVVGMANYSTVAAMLAQDVAVPQFTLDAVLGRYSLVGGYNPNAPPDQFGQNPTDHGAIELDVLNGWRHEPFEGVGLVAFAVVDVHDVELLRYAVQIFGGAYVGVNLPNTAKAQMGRLWAPTAGMVPGDWGGHCTVLDGFDFRRRRRVPELLHATWGIQQRSTEAWWRACGDEAYVPVLTIHQQDPTPAIRWDLLMAYLGQLGRPVG